MKHFNRKNIGRMFVMIAVAAMLLTISVFADTETGFNHVVEPIVNLLNSLLTPLLAVVGAVGSLYCILLGVKYAKAEEPQEREKAKSHLKNALIGFVLIFVMMVVLKLLMPVMIDWVADNTNNLNPVPQTTTQVE